MEAPIRVAIFLALIAIVDIVIETLLTMRIGAEIDIVHGESAGVFSLGAFRTGRYFFALSPLDVLLSSILRCSLSIGVAFGVFCQLGRSRNHSNSGLLLRSRSTLSDRLRKIRIPWVLLTVIVFTYVVAKFLFSMEFNADGTKARAVKTAGKSLDPTTVYFMELKTQSSPTTNNPATTSQKTYNVVRVHAWLWALLGWALFSAILQNLVMYSLGNAAHNLMKRQTGKRPGHRSSSLSINNAEDSQGDAPLLSSNTCSSDDEELISGVQQDSHSDDGSSSDSSSSSSDDSDSASDEDKKRSKKPKHRKKFSKDKPSTSSTVTKLLKQSLPDWILICPGFIFLLIATAAQALLPLYTGKVIDGIAIHRNAKEFHEAIIAMTVLSLIGSICAGCRGGLFTVVCARLNIRLRNRLFGSVVRQDIAFFDTTSTGDITSRLTSDTEKMSDLIGMNINVFSRSIAKAIGVLFFMFKLSWKLTIVTLVSLPAVTIVSYVYGEYYKKLSEKVQTSLAKANDVAEEVCSSMKTVRSFAWESEEANAYCDKLKHTYRLQVKEGVAYAGYAMTTSFLELSSEVVILFYGGYLVLNDEMSAGSLVSFILYCMELASCIEDVGDVFTGLMSAAGAAEKVFEWIERTPDPLLAEDKVKSDGIKGELEFRDVSFRYPNRPECPVLKEVSFSAKPGEVVALVGPSGGGKSSCVSLLERFYQPESGTILLDGQDLNKYEHKSLHNHISLVSQEPILFARSIRDNIKYALPSSTDANVEEAAVAANAHDFISALPNGYRTSTGEKGHQLSGGQKQRVAIARSLIRRPTILLLDEATSALDAESEHILQQSLVRAMVDRTVLVVAHRLSTVEHATRIVVIDDGRVVEVGCHKDLLTTNGLYSKLVQRQLHHDTESIEESGPRPASTSHPADGSKPRRSRQRRRQRSPSTSSSDEAPTRKL